MKSLRIRIILLMLITCSLLFSACTDDLLQKLQTKIDKDRENRFVVFRFTMALNPECEIDAEGVIEDNTVTILIPVNTDVTSLIAEFEFSGKEVVIGDAVQESGVTVNNFSETIQYTVRSLDGSSRIYDVIVRESSDNAELSMLAVERDASGIYEPYLEPSFNTNETDYIYWVPNTVSYVTVTAWTVDSNASASVNGTEIGDSGSAEVSLVDGPNEVEILVTAEDGLVMKSYNLEVYRAVGLPQTYTSYASASYDDDGNLKKGVPWDKTTRFVNNGDGTILDSLTGLLWLEHPVEDISLGYKWDDGTDNALDRIQDLEDGDNGLSDGSARGDWRMPNVNELFSLFCAELDTPGLWLDNWGFTDYNNRSYQFWTSTTAPTSSSFAFFWNQSNGGQGTQEKNGNSPYGSITAVRGPVAQGVVGIPKTGQFYSYPVPGSKDDGYYKKGVAFPNPRFIDNEDGTVLDRLTGLIWLQDWDILAGGSTYAAAMTLIANLDDAGSALTDGSENGDWRMPNIREMHSLGYYAEGGIYGYLVDDLGIFTGIPSTSTLYYTSTNQGSNSSTVYTFDIYSQVISTSPTGNTRYRTAIRSVE